MAANANAHDVLVILPLEEEYGAFCETLRSLEVAFCKIDSMPFTGEFRVLTGARAELKCVVAALGESRLHNPTVNTQELIRNFRPKHVIICGIAMTGLSKDALPGHVTIASEVFGLYQAKEGSYQVHTAEGYCREVAERFHEHSRKTAFKGKLEKLRQNRTMSEPYDHKCVFHHRPIFCRDELISGPQERERIYSSLNSVLRKTTAYDMESHFILQGCSYLRVPSIVIRGLSDDGVNKDKLPQELRAQVVSYCACLIVDGLQHGVLYKNAAPPKLSPYQLDLTVLMSKETSTPFDSLGEAVNALNLSFNVVNTDATIEDFCDSGERSKAALICINESFLNSPFHEILYALEGENESNGCLFRLKASKTKVFLLSSGRFQAICRPPDWSVCVVDNLKDLSLALQTVIKSIGETRPLFEDLEDGFKINQDRSSVYLDCNGSPRILRWNTTGEETFGKLDEKNCSILMGVTERLYRTFRDVQQCLLHAALNNLNNNASLDQIDHIGNEHLRHGMGILETRGRAAIIAYKNQLEQMLKQSIAGDLRFGWIANLETMWQVYNSTYSCVQKLVSRWRNDRWDNDRMVSERTQCYERIADLCVMVEGACHWLLDRQRELSKQGIPT